MESFFSKLKTEWIHGRTYATRRQVEADFLKYIELFYNRQRKHQALEYLSPVAFEQRCHKTTMTQAA